MNTRRAGCGESRTSGSEGGPGKPTESNLDRAPRPDPYSTFETVAGGSWRIAGCADYYAKHEFGWRISPTKEPA